MELITDYLRASESLILIWRAATIGGVIYLIALGLTVLVAKDRALGFLSGFGSNAALNGLEAVIRAFVGLAIMGTAPDNRFPIVAFYFGVILVVTSFGILLLPKLHKKYGVWSMRAITPILPVYGAMSVALGGFILYSTNWGTFIRNF